MDSMGSFNFQENFSILTSVSIPSLIPWLEEFAQKIRIKYFFSRQFNSFFYNVSGWIFSMIDLAPSPEDTRQENLMFYFSLRGYLIGPFFPTVQKVSNLLDDEFSPRNKWVLFSMIKKHNFYHVRRFTIPLFCQFRFFRRKPESPEKANLKKMPTFSPINLFFLQKTCRVFDEGVNGQTFSKRQKNWYLWVCFNAINKSVYWKTSQKVDVNQHIPMF